MNQGKEQLLKIISKNRIRDAKSVNKLAFLSARLRPEGRFPKRTPMVCSVLECYTKEEGECDDCTMMDGYAHILSNSKYTMAAASDDPEPRKGLKKPVAEVPKKIGKKTAEPMTVDGEAEAMETD